VQLVGGDPDGPLLDGGDPVELAARFGVVGELAVIDLDAALGRGSNAGLIRDLCAVARCRVGGGVRSTHAAVEWLDAGASKVILGTAARPEVLRELPRERVIAALDARDGRVVVEGWTREDGSTVEGRIAELREHAGGFLVTFVECEGRMGGLPIQRVRGLAKLAGEAALTVAGGVRNASDIRESDRAGADTQVGMALYTGAITLAEAFAAPLVTDRDDGLWPTVICDERGKALGLAYSNLESLEHAIEHRRGAYHSRSRAELWVKGATSGDSQELLRVDADCDRDALRFTVRQSGSGFCHLGTRSCFGEDGGLSALERAVRGRIAEAPPGSYTRRLLEDPDLLGAKLAEEAGELLHAGDPEHAAQELADVLYFALVAAAQRGASLEDAERELDRRSLRVTRRPGDAKPQYRKPAGADADEEAER
jgi:phosphoribosyl-ATP pyrophosphohydrolase